MCQQGLQHHPSLPFLLLCLLRQLPAALFETLTYSSFSPLLLLFQPMVEIHWPEASWGHFFFNPLFGCTGSQLRHVGFSSWTRDRTQAPCSGIMKSQPLDNQVFWGHFDYLFQPPDLYTTQRNLYPSFPPPTLGKTKVLKGYFSYNPCLSIFYVMLIFNMLVFFLNNFIKLFRYEAIF